MSMKRVPVFTITLMLAAAVAACGPKKPAPGGPAPTPFPTAGAAATTPTPTPPAPPKQAPEPPLIVPPDPGITAGDPLTRAAIEDINKDSPLKPVFFAYDSDVLDDAARKTMAGNAEVMKKYGTWVITIEGHCDERGTAEYNLALGDRRANRGQELHGDTRHRRRPASHGQLRQRVSLRSRARGIRVVAEPPSPLHADIQVSTVMKHLVGIVILSVAAIGSAGSGGRPEPRGDSVAARAAGPAGTGPEDAAHGQSAGGEAQGDRLAP
jgi:peptidoglycan-associated lipoprotein